MKNKDRGNSKESTRRTRKWSICWKLLLLAAFLSFLAIDGYRAIERFQYWRRNSEIEKEYVQAVEQLRQEQRQLEKEIHDLKDRPLVLEGLAREMGYIKPGETVYKIVPQPHDTGSEPTESTTPPTGRGFRKTEPR